MAKNEPDRLSIESSMALAAGMSYGKWKALKKTPTEIPTDIKLPATKRGVKRKFICQWCGKEYVRYDNKKTKYCCEDCQHAAYKKRNRECARKRRANEK